MDIAAKAKALQNLVAAYADLGDEDALDTMLASIRKGSQEEEQAQAQFSYGPRKTGIKRGPYKISGIRQALQNSGVISLEDLVPLVEEHQHVPGKTVQDKGAWLAGQMNKSKRVYREWPDGRWSLRKDNSPGPKSTNGNGVEGSAPSGK